MLFMGFSWGYLGVIILNLPPNVWPSDLKQLHVGQRFVVDGNGQIPLQLERKLHDGLSRV